MCEQKRYNSIFKTFLTGILLHLGFIFTRVFILLKMPEVLHPATDFFTAPRLLIPRLLDKGFWCLSFAFFIAGFIKLPIGRADKVKSVGKTARASSLMFLVFLLVIVAELLFVPA